MFSKEKSALFSQKERRKERNLHMYIKPRILKCKHFKSIKTRKRGKEPIKKTTLFSHEMMQQINQLKEKDRINTSTTEFNGRDRTHL